MRKIIRPLVRIKREVRALEVKAKDRDRDSILHRGHRKGMISMRSIRR